MKGDKKEEEGGGKERKKMSIRNVDPSKNVAQDKKDEEKITYPASPCIGSTKKAATSFP